jgi:hypothetical protein
MIYYTSSLLTLANSSVGHDWAVAPKMAGGVSDLGGEGYGIFKYTHNLPLALAFEEFASSPNESPYFMSLSSLFPYRSSMFTYAVQHNLLSASVVNTVLPYLETSIQGPGNMAYWPQISTYFRGEVPSILSGSVTIQQGLATITQECVSAGATAWSG